LPPILILAAASLPAFHSVLDGAAFKKILVPNLADSRSFGLAIDIAVIFHFIFKE